MKRMSWWIELGAAVTTWEELGDGIVWPACRGEAGWLGGRGILVLGDPGLEADQLEMGMEGADADAGAAGAKEATAASISERVAGGSLEGGGTKEAN